MQGISFSFFLFVVVVFLISAQGKRAAAAGKNGVYIVYMGAASTPHGSLRTDYLRLLNSVARKRIKVVHTYKHGFSGFAARLSEQEAKAMRQRPGVVSVFPDPLLKLHTTHSWDFLISQTSIKIDAKPKSDISGSSSQASDSIIGILDTGVWPESESFSDEGMGPIPSRWKGVCMHGDDFNSSNCNRKLIGARFYDHSDDGGFQFHSPRDDAGHGTHVASTAAGSAVSNASYYGLAAGTAKGGSPKSRIAMYRVCTVQGCTGSAIMAAFDDAIADGVNVLSLSLGSPYFFKQELKDDPIAIGAFHAVEKGIIVVCSAGNDGPVTASVVNDAPWILTVAASTIDRDFESDVVLGNNKVFKGEGINFSALQKSATYPLIQGKSAKKGNDSEDEGARVCNESSMDGNLVKGKIVICETIEGQGPSWELRVEAVKNLGGVGIVFINDESKLVADKFGYFPMTAISSKDGDEVLSYANSTRNPLATILPTVTVIKYKPAPAVAYFSSRGPNPAALNILKPDISAPGVNILAAWLGNDTAASLEGKPPPLFNVLSGTSMACPHVSGVAAFVKSQNPSWGPSAIRSAIMTTAIQTNNLGSPVTTDSGSLATPFDYGAGEVSTTGPLQPGLVYETSTIDYLNYLCYRGYDLPTVKMISQTVPNDFVCPKNSTADISNINYPSIAVSEMKGKESKTVSRTVTNVGGDGETVYTVSVEAPSEVEVKVIPEKLEFTKNNQKQSYQVVFTSTAATPKDELFGSITWTNGKYRVRSPFVVSSKSSEDDYYS